MDLNSTFLTITEEYVTKKDWDELNQKIDNFQKNVLKEHEITQKLLKRVLEEVKSGGNKTTLKRKPILPKTPFQLVTDFSLFEDKIQASENKFNDLVSELMALVCGNSIKFLKTAWRKMITDEVAVNYSWQGTKTKQPVRALSVTAALKQAYNQKFAAASSDSEFERTLISFFQHANNRLHKKINYVNGKKENISQIN